MVLHAKLTAGFAQTWGLRFLLLAAPDMELGEELVIHFFLNSSGDSPGLDSADITLEALVIEY